ncbi:MAG TPA: outer membrane beta-barrel protein [Candidatus Dormibacteraeota bacterium]|nr:outer membrane beta-barrel protein [Candidatus Dormibacteraeota bacterium]
MRADARWKRIVVPAGLALACLALLAGRLVAEDEGKSAATEKEAAAKAATNAAAPKSTIDSPAPGLTERERWLLDRVEQLEKRVSELEAKNPSGGDIAVAGAGVASAEAAAPSSGVASGTASSAAVNSAGNLGEAIAARNAGVGKTAAAASASATSGFAGGVASAALPSGQEKASTTPTKPAKSEPFAFADFTWLNGNARTKDTPYATSFFTPEIRADVDYNYSFNHPKDDTIGGSSEVFRHNEVHVTQLGVGGDFHYDNVRARLMTQFGLYSQTTARNDASPARGQWNLDNAYRYVSEAYGGYHFNALHGINVDAGIFLSYVGLFSYYQFDNWAYQPSYVSSNTPWFFNGVRVQVFPTEHLKIEGWFINGWQAYGRFNGRPGLGAQIQWRPTGWLSVLGNQYALGADAPGAPGRIRYHTDDSIEVKYYDKPDNFVSKAAFSLTGDLGCEHGGGVSCYGNSAKGPKQSFIGFMLYNRLWFHRDHYGLTIGGGKINNPGRYLVLLPPINGATAASGTPYFTENPGDQFKAWDASGTFDWMPSQYVTFRAEFDHRAANVPYFSGPGGVTPSCPTAPIVENICGSPGAFVPGFTPDLKKIENRIGLSMLVKF